MNLTCRTALLLFVTLITISPVFAAEDSPITRAEVEQGYRARTLLARPKAGVRDTSAVESSNGVKLLRTAPRIGGVRTLEADGSEDVKTVIRRLRETGLYDYVEPDYLRFAHVVPNDPRFTSDQWPLKNAGEGGGTAGADIKAPAAWDIQREAPDVIVAVVDSGLRTTHQDIGLNLWTNPTEKAGTRGIDDGNNGYIDDLHGINATAIGTDASKVADVSDPDGHGTHIAGIIGAVGNNGIGVAGVAWKVQVMPLRFLGGGVGGSVSMEIMCIEYALANGAKIINASFGASQHSQAEYEALKRARDAGVIVVASAGNDSQEIMANPTFPAAYMLDNIVAVASTTRQDQLAGYSSYGSGLVDLAAPGTSILSLGAGSDTEYVVKSGTSMAAPHVAGALALLRQKYPNDTYRAIINRLLNSVDVLPAFHHRVQTNGRLNLERALTTTNTRPFNDDFSARPVLTGVTNWARSSNRQATLEQGEPSHGTDATGSLWWSWTVPEGVARARFSSFDSTVPTFIAVYEGDTLGSLRQVAQDGNFGGTGAGMVTIDVTPGKKYSIAVCGKNGGEGQIVLTLIGAPANDAFESAVVLTGVSAQALGNNAGATVQTGEVLPRDASNHTLGVGKSLWYKWTAPSSQRFKFSVTDEDTDPVLSVYTGTAVGGLTELGTNDDSFAAGYRLDSLLDFAATAGTTYYLRVDTSEGNGGRFRISVSDAEWQGLGAFGGFASPATAADGTVIHVDLLGLVHAFGPDGTRKWLFSDSDDIVMSGGASVGSDGTVYFGDASGKIYAIDSTGKLKWTATTGAMISGAPAVAQDGTVYVKSDDGSLYAYKQDGALKWKYPVAGDTYSSPAIAYDGTIYIASSDDAALYALTPHGTLLWRFPLGAAVYASPAIGADGTIYIGNYDGRFFAISREGAKLWHFDTGAALSSSAALDAKGRVYFGSYDGHLYALDAATGAKKWSYKTADIIRCTTPAVAADGTIFIGGDDCFIHALTSDGALVRTYATGSIVYASPVLTNGRLYVATTDGKLHAFSTGSAAAASAWPMHRQNASRAARSVDAPPGVPVISGQASSTLAAVGGGAEYSVNATVPGGGALTYQWRLNGQPIAGATGATYTIKAAQPSDAGTYDVIITGPKGWVQNTPATLAVFSTDAANPTRLTNFSLRGFAGAGDKTLIVGFAVDGALAKPFFIRGIGPTLAGMGVPGTLPDPKLAIFSGSNEILGNDNWTGADGHTAGAFGLPAGSKDAVVYGSFQAGGYTAQVTGVNAGVGEAMVELYDAVPANSATRLVNLSARTQLESDQRFIVGFNTVGSSPLKLYLRAIGPTLRAFGVDTAHTDPRIELYRGNQKIAENDQWSGESGPPGAFALVQGSKDAVLVQTLEPGGYSIHVTSAPGTSGVVLVEIYQGN